jgi:glutamyl-tRNA reductase
LAKNLDEFGCHPPSQPLSAELQSTICCSDSFKNLPVLMAYTVSDAEIVEKHNVTHISIDYLQKISDKNLQERSKEIVHVEQIIENAIASFQYIHRMRKVEIAMREVPNMVKDIRSTAVNEVFKKELQTLDDDSREVLDKVIGYMEKKYMSMPMKLAKDIMLNS